MLAELVPAKLQVVRVPRATLEELKLLPNCSPFSEAWMSGLDNRRSKKELGIVYTPLAKYLKAVVRHYNDNPKLMPQGYGARDLEIQAITKNGVKKNYRKEVKA